MQRSLANGVPLPYGAEWSARAGELTLTVNLLDASAGVDSDAGAPVKAAIGWGDATQTGM